MDAGTCLTFALLIPLLGHDDFRTREQAHAFLAPRAALARPWLERGLTSTDPETAYRCAAMLRQLWADDLDHVSMPWIDCIDAADSHWLNGCERWIETAEYNGYYLRLANLAGHDNRGPDWKNQREATRYMCRDLIHGGARPEEVRKIIALMWEKCVRWNPATGCYDLPPPEPIAAPTAKE